MKRAIENALLIAWMKFYPDFRTQPYIVAIQAGISGSPLFFFIIAGSSTAFSNGIVGAMVAIISFVGLTSSIQDVSQDRYIKIREIMVSMPVHPASYAFGIALAPLLMSMPGVLTFIAIAIWMGLVNQIMVVWLLAALILCWICTSMLGFITSTYLSKLPIFIVNGFARILSLSLIFLPPVYYSDAALGQFSWVSYIFPTSNTACLIRIHLCISNSSVEALVLRWLILFVTTVFLVLFACFKTKWREK